MTATDTCAELEQKILRADSLPTLPVAAMKVLELTQLPDVSANEIAKVIQTDPALSAKLLKTANSSMFGMSKKVASLQQAMVLLGLRTVKVMALSFSLVDTFSGRQGENLFDFEKYWRRSLSTAVAAKLLAEAATESRRDEAFVGGLLADLGIVAAFRCAPEEYLPALQAYAEHSLPLQDVEQQLLGVTHAGISACLLRHWSLPDMLCDAVSAHHGEGFDGLAGRTRMLSGVLWAAAMVADLFCGDLDLSRLEEVKKHCMTVTGIKEGPLEELLESIDTHVTETASVFSLDIGETVGYEEIRTRAMAQLAAMSMDAELGRVEATRREESTRQQLVELSDQAATLRQQANTDPLTKIGNRQAFEVGLQEAIEQARACRGNLGLIILDLDHFKKLNDSYGHQAGDEALRAVGRCLAKITDGGGLAARYGGEEFAIIVPSATAREVRHLADDVRKTIGRQQIEHEGQQIRFTASLGAVHIAFAHEQADAASMIKRADECLYDAKRNGRDRVEITF